ncbi:MAG: helix-turn-helix domain-containing protein [Bacteroidota bacterium]
MKLSSYIYRINLLHKLIKERRTGTPEELAKRLRLSKSRLSRIIEELKLEGVPLAYSRQIRSYYYTIDYKMQASLEFTSIG